jgi:hypothetical protein
MLLSWLWVECGAYRVAAGDASSLSRQGTSGTQLDPTSSFSRAKALKLKGAQHQATVPFAKDGLPFREADYLEPSRTKQVHRRRQFSNHSI